MANSTETRYVYPSSKIDLAELNNFIKRNVGNMCYASSITDDEDKIVSIGVCSDEVIWNSETGEPSLRFRKHNDVFTCYFETVKHNMYLVVPPRKEINRSFVSSVKSYTERSETKILESIGSRILEIPQIHNQMNPIFEIVGTLLILGDLSMSDFKTWDREKTSRYLGFLKELNILSIEGDRIVPGDVMNKMDQRASFADIYKGVLTQVVNLGMLMMFYTLNMTHLHPFIKLTNVNCMTSLNEDSALKWDWKAYQYYMQKIYHDKRNSDKMKIVSKALELSSAGIFNKEKNRSGDIMFYCDDGVFDKYVKSCKHSPLIY